jgi:hypothetical protein
MQPASLRMLAFLGGQAAYKAHTAVVTAPLAACVETIQQANTLIHGLEAGCAARGGGASTDGRRRTIRCVTDVRDASDRGYLPAASPSLLSFRQGTVVTSVFRR